MHLATYVCILKCLVLPNITNQAQKSRVKLLSGDSSHRKKIFHQTFLRFVLFGKRVVCYETFSKESQERTKLVRDF